MKFVRRLTPPLGTPQQQAYSEKKPGQALENPSSMTQRSVTSIIHLCPAYSSSSFAAEIYRHAALATPAIEVANGNDAIAVNFPPIANRVSA